MKECSKSIPRRLHDANFSNRYFVGDGLDIGGKPDPLALYQELFPRITSVRTWDWEDGDAQYLQDVPDASFHFVHSSHCLEHLRDVAEGLANWFRVVRPGGYLVVTVPDEDLYEQGRFPSTFNKDHKATFTVHKQRSWSEHSHNVTDLIDGLGDEAQTIKIELIVSTHRFALPRFDQTLTPIAESAIEFVVRKRPTEEVERLGLYARPADVPDDMRVYLNQYLDDHEALKELSKRAPPFQNRSKLKG